MNNCSIGGTATISKAINSLIENNILIKVEQGDYRKSSIYKINNDCSYSNNMFNVIDDYVELFREVYNTMFTLKEIRAMFTRKMRVSLL